MVPMTKIYLAEEWFNDKQKEWTQEAINALDKNPTVGVIHMPFDLQYKGATVDGDVDGVFGSPVWIQSTFENDVHAMSTSDAGVFLIDMDNPDSGSCMELGYMYANDKPIIIVPKTKNPNNVKINLMLAGGATCYLNDVTDLETYNFNHPAADFTAPYPVF